MKSSMRRLLGTFAVTVASALALLATTAAVALATVPGGLVDGQGQNIGRGGGFTVTTPSGWSSLDVVAGVAISAAAVALVVWLGISSDNRARTRLKLAPSGSSGEDLSARTADQERKAA
jgi:hypothetical protein